MQKFSGNKRRKNFLSKMVYADLIAAKTLILECL